MSTTKTRLETLLETDRFPSIARLYSWGLNYDYKANPFALFCDLIGLAHEEFDTTLFDLQNELVDYHGGDALGHALLEWTNSGEDAYNFARDLVFAESEEN